MVFPVEYIKDVAREMQRVTWPNSRTVALHTGIVIVSMVVTIGIVGSIDAGLVQVVQALLLKR